MKARTMQIGSPGSSDLVLHTIKHFFAPGERGEWDQLPAGTATAEALLLRKPQVGKLRLSVGDPVDNRWWVEPWLSFAHDAHDAGYAPRYLRLVDLLGQPGGGRWERQWGQRWVGDIGGFRIVVDSRTNFIQVQSAFFSCVFRHGDQPGAALRAFRAHCPPVPSSRVSGEKEGP